MKGNGARADASLPRQVCAFVPAAALLRLPAVVALVNPQIGSSLAAPPLIGWPRLCTK